MTTSISQDSKLSGMNSCKVLEQAADVQLYIKNTFRVTGLPIFASEKDIKKRADRQKMLERLGHEEEGLKIAYPLLTPPTADQITAAIQRLKNPELRLVDEFFWFLPETIDKPEDDSAYQAILAGDQDTAFQIWSSKEDIPFYGSIAKHNLAVLFHLTALDWTDYQLGNGQKQSTLPFLEVEREEKIRNYWSNALTRWKQVCNDDKIQDYIRERIKVLDDPRLTTGFGRRLFESLSSSICKINADIALRFVKANKLQWATEHIQYMQKLGLSKPNLEKVLAQVLSTQTDQVRLFIKTAEEGYKTKPEEGCKKCEKLINDCTAIKNTFDLFLDNDSHLKRDLFDEVATTGINCIVQYQIKTGDNQSFVNILKLLKSFAFSSEVTTRIDNNIKIGENNLKGERNTGLYKTINDIRDSKALKGHAKLLEFKKHVLSKLIDAAERDGALSESMIDLYDACARALRSISIDAYNNENAFHTALETINLASLLAKDKELKNMIKADINTVEETIRTR